MAQTITADNYETVVEKSAGLVLLDVWAPWCVPCKIIDPIVEAAAERSGVELLKLNIEDLPELAGKLGIGGLPTVRLLRGGRTIFEAVGTLDPHRLAAALDAAL